MANVSIHWIQNVAARRHDYDLAPLKLEIRSEYDQMPHEIVLFLENDALTKDLVEAINGVVAKHQAAPVLAEAAE